MSDLPAARARMTQSYDPAFRALHGAVSFRPHPSARLFDGGPAWHCAFALDPPAPLSPDPAPAAPQRQPPQPRLQTLYRIDAPPARPRRRVLPVLLAAAALLLLLAGVAAMAPGLLGTAEAAAVFSAPTLKLHAVGPGQVASVAVAVGQAVEPDTVVLTLRADPLTDAALGLLRARLDGAQARQAGGHEDPRQADATALEIDQLQRAIATSGAPLDLPVRAGVRGTVRALDASPGGRIRAGSLLVQIVDCGRAFLVLGDAAPWLKPGSAVQVHVPGLAGFGGTVRPSAGLSEPAGTLVVAPTGLAAVAPQACPVGASAMVQPSS